MPGSLSPFAPNIMFYCHDTYGLGHLRRTLTIAQYLRAHNPLMSQLIVTGSPVAQHFPFPAGADYIKLPSVVKVGAGQYRARSIAIPFNELRNMRADIVRCGACHFAPDALIVDHAPAGLEGEIVPTLHDLKDNLPHTRLILGLRDIVDEAPRVRHTWASSGVYHLLDELYDLILVYGQRDIYDVVAAYGLSSCAAAKVRYVGYLQRESGARSVEQIRAELGMQTNRLVVVTAGGGGDGYNLFRTVLEAMQRRPTPIRFDCLLIGGPLMAAEERARLLPLVGTSRALHFLEFTQDMASYLAAADVVVSMGGYNSVCELLSLGRPAILVPRVAPRKEQLIRAELLSQRGLVRMIHPAALSPGVLLDAVHELLEHPPQTYPPLRMDGLPGVATALHTLLQARGSASHDDELLAAEVGGAPYDALQR